MHSFKLIILVVYIRLMLKIEELVIMKSPLYATQYVLRFCGTDGSSDQLRPRTLAVVDLSPSVTFVRYNDDENNDGRMLGSASRSQVCLQHLLKLVLDSLRFQKTTYCCFEILFVR